MVLIIVFLSIFLVCIFLYWRFYKKKSRKSDTHLRRRLAPVVDGTQRFVGPNRVHGRRLRPRMRESSESDDSHQDTNEQNNDNPSVEQLKTVDIFKKRVGTKKAAKLIEKEKRKEEREAEERYREHQRKLEDKEIEKQKKAEEIELKTETSIAECKAKEEAEREQAEYELLKQQFSIEDEGMEEPEIDNKAEAQLNAQIIGAIQEAKVVSIERLSLNFNLKTETCVEKIRSFMATNRLTGVLDDRGKFIYITNREYEAVAQFIEKRGRVSISELVQNGHKLIQINNQALRC